MSIERRNARILDNRHLFGPEMITYHDVSIIEFHQLSSSLELFRVANNHRNTNSFHTLHYLKTIASAWIILTFSDLLL